MDGVVEVRGGRIRGVQRQGYWSFSGVPYAGSPGGVGAAGGRPARPTAWTGVRECDRFGPIAPQIAGLIELSLGGEPDEHAGGLPDPQRLDAGARREPAAGDGLGPWRLVRLGLRGRAASTEVACCHARATSW